jgi:hypothetical protein
MNKLLKKAVSQVHTAEINTYEIFQLTENPFPTMASVNESSPEKKYNGSIYERSIREEEYKKLESNFLTIPQSNPDHLRLGFLSETSYIGRGNGKTSFLVNLMRILNTEYCLDISNNNNKCFSIYFFPDSGGIVKSFEKFVDYFFAAMLKSNIINECLALLRYDALSTLGWGDLNADEEFKTGDDLVFKLTNDEWCKEHLLHSKRIVMDEILKNNHLGTLPSDFPLYKDLTFLAKMISQEDFGNYYKQIRGEKMKLDYVFTHMVNFFLAAGFNGSYILVDDFERIPDFQSAMQKKDFILQLRTVLFDGGYLNARIGFFNFIIALHAGVPRLIQEAWNLAGMEQRISIVNGNGTQKHLINFEKIDDKHAIKLIKKYLSEYRTSKFNGDSLFPFDEKSIVTLAAQSEMNISKILQSANNILEYALQKGISFIDEKVILSYLAENGNSLKDIDEPKAISNVASVDLASKIQTKK